ncbi:MAG: hypothetical protein AAF385_14355 [Pseudomonadota bacterium]
MIETIVQIVLGGIVGSLITIVAVETLERNREKRESLHALVTAWHSGVIAGNRQLIVEWLLSEQGVRLRSNTPEGYRTAQRVLIQEQPIVVGSVLAVADFFRTTDICVNDGRCDRDKTLAAFGPVAREFHDTFGVLLRQLDCEEGYTGTEDPVLRIARRDALDIVERCIEFRGG